jgi:hypothetical protein
MAERSRRRKLADISRSLAFMEDKLDGLQYQLQELLGPSEYQSACESIYVADGALVEIRDQITVMLRTKD